MERRRARRRAAWRRRRLVLLLMSPWLVGFSVFFGYPIVMAVYLSLNHYDLLSPPRWVGLANYRYLFTIDPQVGTAVKNTLWLVAVLVPAQVLFALGIAMISGGIIVIALQGRRVSRAGTLAALTTGATIALYTVIDGIGVRLSDGRSLNYTAWMFLFYWLMPLLFVATRGFAPLWTPVRAEPLSIGSSLVGGLVSIAAYGIVIWAMQSGAMGAVSALRETSVVFAVLIGRVFLRETVSAKRWLACVVVAAGAVCLGL